MGFEHLLKTSPLILTEAAVVERLKHEHHLGVDPHINHAGLIYDAPDIVAGLYRQYIDIALKHDLPIMLMTPTRRVNCESLERSAYHGRPLIQDCCNFMMDIRTGYSDMKAQIFTGGLLGCKGDAYSTGKGLSMDDAYHFHIKQVELFSDQNLDYLFAGIMPEKDEAIGMAEAMAESGLPYVISFMIKNNGCLLDGTAISDAISEIDDKVDLPPVCHMVNCVHPANVLQALTQKVNLNSPHITRLKGIQANSSPLPPEDLDNSDDLLHGNPEDMVALMHRLQADFGFNMLGGCCGTDDHFLDNLAKTCGA